MRSRSEERMLMVDQQIEARGVRSPGVIAAMHSIPRHLFVPSGLQAQAYEDRPLPIGSGQTISQPYIVAFMLEALDLKEGDRVLEIGTGSGYQTALLASLCAEVTSLERIPELHLRAAEILAEFGAKNVRLILGDGYDGASDNAPYNAIVLSAAPPHIPRILLRQLAPDGGVLVAPVGRPGIQDLVRVRRKGDEFGTELLMAVSFVPMLPGARPRHDTGRPRRDTGAPGVTQAPQA